MSRPVHYFVTDIEADGPSPFVNSMLSFATVVVRSDGEIMDSFEATLLPLPERRQDSKTMEWWKTQPEAWAHATADAKLAAAEMERFSAWVRSIEGHRAFSARPLLFDGMWIDQYLRHFTPYNIFEVPYWGEMLFDYGALDIGSFTTGALARTVTDTYQTIIPPDWLGERPHTHRAVDDAAGYANLLSNLLKFNAGLSGAPETMMRRPAANLDAKS
jgi:hypothetical protein